MIAKKVLSLRSETTTRSTWPSRSVMMLRSRSCVIGRGVAMFSICRAMAFASKMPTQIGSTRSPPLSFRMTIGMLVIGSTISPLMLISISIDPLASCRVAFPMPPAYRLVEHFSPEAVRSGTANCDLHGLAQPRTRLPVLARNREVHDGVPAGPSRHFSVPPPADRVHQHGHRAPDRLLV